MFNDKSILKQFNKAFKHLDYELIDFLFEKTYLEYKGLIFYISNNIIKNREDANDIVQDTFYSLYNELKNNNIRNIKYFLVVSAKNKSINKLKENDKEIITSEFNDNLTQTEDKISPIINELKNILDNEELDIIILHLVYNFSFKEIGKLLNKNVDQVNSKYQRTIKKIKNKNILK